MVIHRLMRAVDACSPSLPRKSPEKPGIIDCDRANEVQRRQHQNASRYHDLAEGAQLLNVEELLVHVADGELTVAQLLDKLLVVLELQLTAQTWRVIDSDTKLIA